MACGFWDMQGQKVNIQWNRLIPVEPTLIADGADRATQALNVELPHTRITDCDSECGSSNIEIVEVRTNRMTLQDKLVVAVCMCDYVYQ